MALAYFRYISDAKVDQYFDRIPPRLLERITAELKIDLKLVQITLKPESREPSRYARLAVVKKYLEEHEDVGTVQDPRSWFRGTTSLAQARAGRDAGAVVVFAGRSRATLLGLTGSLRHVIGDVSGAIGQGSQIYGVVDAYTSVRRLDRNRLFKGPAHVARTLNNLVEGIRYDYEDTMLPCEFLARLLMHRNVDGRRGRCFLLGTPLYVAEVDVTSPSTR
jgi:hypothetical protein